MHTTEGSPTEADQQLNQIYPGIAKCLQVHKLPHTFNKNVKMWMVLRLFVGLQRLGLQNVVNLKRLTTFWSIFIYLNKCRGPPR